MGVSSPTPDDEASKRQAAGATADKPATGIASRFLPLLSCVTYSCCSMAMVLCNKLVLSSYGMKSSFSLLAFQAACSAVLLWLARAARLLDVESLQPALLLKWLPVNLLFCGMLYSGFQSLQHLTVPLATIFKNLTNIGILAGDAYFFGQRASMGVVSSLLVIVLGAVLAGWSDIAFDFTGYVWMGINCVVTASYVLYLKAAMSSVKLSKFGLAYYNNVLAIPITLVMAAIMQEGSAFVVHPAWQHLGFLVAMLVSGALGLGLGLASMWCVSATSPSTYSTVGSLSKIPLSVLGVVLFSVQVTWNLAVFVSLSLIGGIMFSYAKTKESQMRAAAVGHRSPPVVVVKK